MIYRFKVMVSNKKYGTQEYREDFHIENFCPDSSFLTTSTGFTSWKTLTHFLLRTHQPQCLTIKHVEKSKCGSDLEF